MNKISNKIRVPVPRYSLKDDTTKNLQRGNCRNAIKQDYLGKIEISLCHAKKCS